DDVDLLENARRKMILLPEAFANADKLEAVFREFRENPGNVRGYEGSALTCQPAAAVADHSFSFKRDCLLEEFVRQRILNSGDAIFVLVVVSQRILALGFAHRDDGIDLGECLLNGKKKHGLIPLCRRAVRRKRSQG